MDMVVSPCRGTCTLSPHTGWCYGCLRTEEEITHWATRTNEERREILKRINARHSLLNGDFS